MRTMDSGVTTTPIQPIPVPTAQPSQRFAPRRSASTMRSRTVSTPSTDRSRSHGETSDFADPGLTAREIAVLGAWLRCDSKQEVCAVLHIALGTVNTHLTRIRAKYSTVGRAAPTKASLVARALQDGLVTLDDL